MSEEMVGAINALLRKARSFDSPEVIKALEDFAIYCGLEIKDGVAVAPKPQLNE